VVARYLQKDFVSILSEAAIFFAAQSKDALQQSILPPIASFDYTASSKSDDAVPLRMLHLFVFFASSRLRG
jgi:hypothetical protein